MGSVVFPVSIRKTQVLLLTKPQAFEKVDQPCEDSRKGFMWRLTEEAIRDGVKSTTRYRSKQPNKRGHRTQPQPQRQASGAKGGQAARRAAKVRRSHRMHGMYTSRSVPSAFDPLYGSAEVKVPYPPSTFHSGGVDCGYQMNEENNGNPFPASQAPLFSPTTPYMGSPLQHEMPVNDSALNMDTGSDGSFYTDSPSPPTDALPNPVSQDMWNTDLVLGSSYVQDMFGFRKYND